MPYAHPAVAARKHPLARALLSALAMGCSLPLLALDAPAKLQVPTLAYDEQQIILVWEKPADHARSSITMSMPMASCSVAATQQ